MCGCVCSRRRRLTVTSDVVREREEKCECNLSSENIVFPLSIFSLNVISFLRSFSVASRTRGEREKGGENAQEFVYTHFHSSMTNGNEHSEQIGHVIWML